VYQFNTELLMPYITTPNDPERLKKPNISASCQPDSKRFNELKQSKNIKRVTDAGVPDN
jgi:hypothetical protein